MIPSQDGAAATEPPKLGQCCHAKIGLVLVGLISFSKKIRNPQIYWTFPCSKATWDWHIEGQTQLHELSACKLQNSMGLESTNSESKELNLHYVRTVDLE